MKFSASDHLHDKSMLMQSWAPAARPEAEMACAAPSTPSVPTRRNRRTRATRMGRWVRHVAAIYRLNRINNSPAMALLLTFSAPLPF